MYFGYSKIPVNIFGNSASPHDKGIKLDTSLIVQKPYPKTKDFESNTIKDTDLQNKFRIKKFPDPISNRKAASKNYLDKKFSDPSIKNNTTHVDFNDKNLDNVRFVEVKSRPAVGEHLTVKKCVNKTISSSADQTTLVRNTQNNDFLNLT